MRQTIADVARAAQVSTATVDRVLDDPLARGFCTAAMAEAAAVGARIGECTFDVTK